MITLVGVGHVFDLRDRIRKVIEDRRPAVVGVELDSFRYQALLARTPKGPPLGIYAFIAYVQRRIAREYGTEVGGEMEAAARAAQDVGATLAFIDLDSRVVLARLLNAMSFGEKVRFALSVFGGLFIGRKQVERELAKFDQNQQTYFDELARHFPAVKRVLLDERNDHMARALRGLEAKHGSVLAVVGEGHVDGLRTLLSDRPLELIRLRDLRTAPATGNATATISFRS
ncbi:MAG TPA: TraB/GumN family protein [Thermoplasmata archaeon]|nr:TraB/GumN family protein [Thermoplasmata archaeon]